MHIMEGFLPIKHALFWTGVALPFWVIGLKGWRKQMKMHPESKLLLGAMGGFTFALSALKIPSVSGSSSHATGIGMGTVLFGPSVMTLVGTMVLLFQALFLAHGGLSTLGANVFSMAVVGPWVAYVVSHGLQKLPLNSTWGIFGAAFCSNMATYICTASQLAWAFPDPLGGILGAWIKFNSIFAMTQIPLALIEATLSVLLIQTLSKQAPIELLHQLPYFKKRMSSR